MVEAPCTRSDSELIAQSLRGDGSAFGALVLRHRTVAIGTAYRICGDAALAEDVAQEAFVRIWDRLSAFRPEGNFRAWLCRIAANLTIDALRRQKPEIDLERVPVQAPDPGPEASALQQERGEAIRAAIMELPLPTRTALILREYEGLSYQEIADTLDIPLGTVKSRLNDARRRLQAGLSSFMGQEEERASRC
jgi:RNA polymerase sigma-70 factor (ECF subfamily)